MTDSPLVRTMVGANPRRTALRVVVLIVSAYIMFGHLLMPIRGFGVSMEPTIEEGDLLFVNRMAYRFRVPQRGDVVAVQIAGRSVVYVKRQFTRNDDHWVISAVTLMQALQRLP